MDGYAFCLGIQALEKFCVRQPQIHSSIYQVDYLIRGALSRLRGQGQTLMGINSLGKLIDMYHTHGATLRSDKVYALLDMSSDAITEAGLSLDYNISWESLFETLTRFLLGRNVVVEALPDTETAVICSKVYILGSITSISKKMSWASGQSVEVTGRELPGKLKISSTWVLPASAKPVMVGDIVCLHRKASMPTIMRFCNNQWLIIRIATPPPKIVTHWAEKTRWSHYLHLVKLLGSRKLRCVWDWGRLSGNLQGQEANNQSLDSLEKTIGSWKDVLSLHDAKRYKEAADTFEGALSAYGATFGNGSRCGIATQKLSRLKRSDREFLKKSYSGSSLLRAAKRGNLASIDLLTRYLKADLNFCNYHDETPLLLATSRGHLTIVKWLLRKKVDCNTKASKYGGRTALQAAAEGGHLAIVERLLQEKADVNAAIVGSGARTALQAAASSGYLEVVERLLQAKADINAPAGYRGRTALQAAAENGHLQVVERLLCEKADVNAPAGALDSKIALEAAARHGHLAIVERLLQEKADINPSAASCGSTPLEAAARGGHLEGREAASQACRC